MIARGLPWEFGLLKSFERPEFWSPANHRANPKMIRMRWPRSPKNPIKIICARSKIRSHSQRWSTMEIDSREWDCLLDLIKIFAHYLWTLLLETKNLSFSGLNVIWYWPTPCNLANCSTDSFRRVQNRIWIMGNRTIRRIALGDLLVIAIRCKLV